MLPLRPAATAHPLAALVQQFNQQAPAYQQFRAALSATLQRCATRSVDGLVMHLARQAGNPGRVWALLLHHLHAEQQLALADVALGLVERELASLPALLRQSLHAQLLAAAPGGGYERTASGAHWRSHVSMPTRLAVVTGTSAGLGLEVARALLAAGWIATEGRLVGAACA